MGAKRDQISNNARNESCCSQGSWRGKALLRRWLWSFRVEQDKGWSARRCKWRGDSRKVNANDWMSLWEGIRKWVGFCYFFVLSSGRSQMHFATCVGSPFVASLPGLFCIPSIKCHLSQNAAVPLGWTFWQSLARFRGRVDGYKQIVCHSSLNVLSWLGTGGCVGSFCYPWFS